MADRYQKVRRARRVPLRSPVRSEVNGRFDAAVLDLSDHGARIEHREIVHPGQVYILAISLPRASAPLGLLARAVWSAVHRFERVQESVRLVYHSGLEFEGVPVEVRPHLEEFLAKVEGSASTDGRPVAEIFPA